MAARLEEQIGFVHLLDPQDLASTDTASSILDLAGFNAGIIVVGVGILTGVDGSNYVTPVLQECDTKTGTEFGNVAAGDWSGTFAKIDAATKDQVTQYASYRGKKRYIRVNLDYTGTGVSASLLSVLGVVGKSNVEPVTAPAAVTAV